LAERNNAHGLHTAYIQKFGLFTPNQIFEDECVLSVRDWNGNPFCLFQAKRLQWKARRQPNFQRVWGERCRHAQIFFIIRKFKYFI